MKKIPTVCDYCGGKVIRCPASELYGRRGVGNIYMCTNCNAAVGIDKDGCPKGRLANAALRSKRIEAHLVFDHFWQSHHMTRSAGYAWMAAVMKMPTYVGRLFKRSTGITLVEYILEVRMDAARTLLTDTDLSVTEIVPRVGFGDAPYFYKVFKKTNGCTPAQYRVNQRGLGKVGANH
ncbi:zinc-finger-containing protein [Eubacterium callanderi]|uniref:zinc-finger-containing protein n=1 Tax=Eubacterium callanderi TaxID=53442 RepID=UPI003AF154F5